MNKKIITICEWAVVVLALIGIITLGNISHELTHYYDALKQNGTVTSVCFLKLPLDYEINKTWLSGSVGLVTGTMPDGEELNSPEWKALTVGFVTMLILSIIAMIGFWIGESRKND